MEEISEAIAGFWSESGLAISSFIPKSLGPSKDVKKSDSRRKDVHFVGMGSLFDLGNEEKEAAKDVVELEIPLQNVNFWKNNSRGLNYVFSDNKLIVFKVTK